MGSWFCEYMLESATDVHTSASLPHGMLITIILLHYSIDLSDYLVVEFLSIYDSKTFTSMDYVLVEMNGVRRTL